MTLSKLSGRAVSVRLKTARGRDASSQRWLMRQLNDPYVQQAQLKGTARVQPSNCWKLNRNTKF